MQQQQPIVHDIIAERTDTIVRSVASGQNSCGTLYNQDGTLNRAFVAASVRPTLEVYESEAEMYRRDKMELSRIAEEYRQALEFIYSNAVGQLPKQVADRLCQVLGFCPSA